MSRYEVKKHRHKQYWVFGNGLYIGLDCEFDIADLSEAEANIIAFALNAIAEGFTLLSFDGVGSTTYEGPTEGVKP